QMPKLWISNQDHQWSATPLDNAEFAIGEAALLSCGGAHKSWVLVASPQAGVRLNGQPVPLGIRVLVDRDAIAGGADESVFFSTQESSCVAPFSKDRAAPCARCKAEIKPGEASVKCPHCGAFHHQSEEWGCWDYDDKCAACSQPTRDIEQWTPEQL